MMRGVGEGFARLTLLMKRLGLSHMWLMKGVGLSHMWEGTEWGMREKRWKERARGKGVGCHSFFDRSF